MSRVLKDVTIGTFEVLDIQMEEREGRKISYHATDSDKGNKADRTVVGLTMRQ